MLSFFFPALRPPKHEANSGSAATSDEQLHIGLERLCRLPRYQPGRSVLSVPDDQVKQVVRVLQILDTKNGRAEWAKWSARPRTYIILRNVGGIDLMSQFVHGGYTDFELPYENRTLPGFIEDNVMRKEFLQVQVHLLTSAKELESLSHQSSPTGVLPHINFDGPGEQHFLRISNLGQGGFGAVDEVLSMLSLHHYARKRVARGRHSSEANRKAQEYLVKELTDLKSLSHRHLVKVFGSYTDPEYIAFLMKPVAEGNLHDFLRQTGGLNDRDRHDVRQYFGCLAGAVHYLHGCNIRHRDLSSKNVLISQGILYISDLGSAHKWTNNATHGSMTQDRNTPTTIEYMAPEVAKRQPRSSSSDMWSLGVVYLEMATILVGRTLPQLQTYIVRKAGRRLEPYIWANPPVVNSWVNELQQFNQGPRHDNEPLVWIRDLLQESSENRPKSRGLMQDILECPSFSIFCCIKCQPEFRDRKFAYNDVQTTQEETFESPTDLRDNIAHIFKRDEPRAVMSKTTTASIENWLAGTESKVPRHDSLVMPGSFVYDEIAESGDNPPVSEASFASADEENVYGMEPHLQKAPPPPPDFNLLDDASEESSTIEPITLLEDCDLYPTLETTKPRKHPPTIRKPRVRDTGLGFLEYDSSSSDEDKELSRFNESEDSSGSDSDSEATVKPSADQEGGLFNVNLETLPASADEQHEWLRLLDSIPAEEGEMESESSSPHVFRNEEPPNCLGSIEGHTENEVGHQQVEKVTARLRSDQVAPSTTYELSSEPVTSSAHAMIIEGTHSQEGLETNSSDEPRQTDRPYRPKETKAPISTTGKPKLNQHSAKDPPKQPLAPVVLSRTYVKPPVDDTGKSAGSSHTVLAVSKNRSKQETGGSTGFQNGETGRESAHVQPNHGNSTSSATPAIQITALHTKDTCKVTASVSKSPLPQYSTKDTCITATSSSVQGDNASPRQKDGERERPVRESKIDTTKSSAIPSAKPQKPPTQTSSWSKPLPTDPFFRRIDSAKSPGVSASAYIEDTWESASTVATSVMSEDTRRLLKGFNLNKWWDKDYEFLEKYCSKGSVAAVRMLLEQGCNPGRPPGSKQGRRIGPILNAIRGRSLRHNKCVRELLNHGADVNVRSNRTGKTPLHAAIENANFRGYEHLVRMLIEAGGDTNQADFKDDRPIMKVFYSNDTGPLEDHRRKALALLLRDPTTKVDMVLPGTLNTPLHLAIRRRDAWAVGMLVYRAADVNAKNASGSTPLLLVAGQFQGALSTEHVRILEFLLEREGIALDEKAGNNEQTALHYAVKAGAAVAVNMLLDHGADASIKDNEGNDALALAIKNVSRNEAEQHASIMSRLIGSLGTPRPVDRKTCLVDAACAEQQGLLMSKLLTKGMDVDLIKGGQTLLHLAILHKNRIVVDMLVEHRACVDMKNAEGISVVKYAVKMGQIHIAKHLVKKGKYLKKENKARDTAEVNGLA